jgi:hypothetical protein
VNKLLAAQPASHKIMSAENDKFAYGSGKAACAAVDSDWVSRVLRLVSPATMTLKIDAPDSTVRAAKTEAASSAIASAASEALKAASASSSPTAAAGAAEIKDEIAEDFGSDAAAAAPATSALAAAPLTPTAASADKKMKPSPTQAFTESQQFPKRSGSQPPEGPDEESKDEYAGNVLSLKVRYS